MASTGRSALIVGLKSPPEENQEMMAFIRKSVDSESEKARAAGYDVADHLVTADGSAFDELHQTLKSRPWDVVAIGFGVRGNAALTPLFETLVNAVIVDVQPLPKLAFPATIDGIYEAIERVMKGTSS